MLRMLCHPLTIIPYITFVGYLGGTNDMTMNYDYEISLYWTQKEKKRTQRYHKQQNGRNDNKKY